ncbi:S9 family peptidase [Microbacterium xanthum]|uniref:S9 family peptidase n=1 Tax=Microbacterium xanthum TaxID=3079794 RepID=UPI002AD2FACC|nr:prolyl oligopeptidase family serine peptidase [Microbacterium sp. KSW-48]MDZ8171326.1 prolyl oligopeptidase family serine peptidase [Microbacterium sp. KSW-48]
MTSVLPYGSWPSPITAAAASSSSSRVDGARFVGDDIWWGEPVPAQAGRVAVRRRGVDGQSEDVLPEPWNARSGVHEYGGGAWTAADDGTLFFVEKTDQRVYAAVDGAVRPLTAAAGDVRHGGLVWQDGVLLAVREDHTADNRVPARAIVRIPTDGSAADDPTRIATIVRGSDFLAQPALSPDGSRLAWVAWDHPHMPWERAEVRVGRIDAGRVRTWTTPGSGERSVLQPRWLDDRTLLYVDDASGRWNLMRWTVGEEPPTTSFAPADADTGGGLWVLGASWYGIAGDHVVAIRTDGADHVVSIDQATGETVRIDVPTIAGTVIEDTRRGRALISGAEPTGGMGLWIVQTADGSSSAVRESSLPWADVWTPRAEPVSVDGPSGPVHAFAYPPTNPDVVAPDGERPPYVLLVHGGPTAHVGPVASARTAYLTSRGIGVLDVNYGGSTGYGRAYRERLRGQWGVVDVQDVIAAAHGLAAEGSADPDRIAIAGGSAGGWTVLGALVAGDVFRAGISRYGVGDARALAEDTHDFEARYLDGLIGPLPEAEALYIERSPLTHAERFSAPLLLLQGSEDAVVPPAQSEAIRDALAARGVPHAYVLYEGEGHGFRRAETIVHAMESEYAFLGAVFGFDTPGVTPLTLQR